MNNQFHEKMSRQIREDILSVEAIIDLIHDSYLSVEIASSRVHLAEDQDWMASSLRVLCAGFLQSIGGEELFYVKDGYSYKVTVNGVVPSEKAPSALTAFHRDNLSHQISVIEAGKALIDSYEQLQLFLRNLNTKALDADLEAQDLLAQAKDKAIANHVDLCKKISSGRRGR